MATMPFARAADGGIDVRLGEPETVAVRHVVTEMLALLADPNDDASARLFPRSHASDDVFDQEFRSLTRDDLIESRRRAAGAVLDSLDAGTRSRRGAWSAHLDDETAHAWLTTLNDARLVLGTRIDVNEDTDHRPLPENDPDAPAHNLYLFLSSLVSILVDELSAGLPEDKAAE